MLGKIVIKLLAELLQCAKMKNKKYHTVGTVPKSNRKIVERGKVYTPNTQIHDRSLSCEDYKRM